MMQKSIANLVHSKLAAVCPVDSVSIGRINDKSTWRIDHAAGATPEQIAAAAAVVAAFDPDEPTGEAVNAERDRRLKMFTFGGKSFDFCDGKGSDINIAGAGTLALAAIIQGAQAGDLRWAGADADFTWIAADNTSVSMDALTCLNFAKAAADWKARHIRAARVIKNMSPVPADYASDSRW